MATYSPDKQTAGCNSPHNWLVSVAMDLAALCDMSVEVYVCILFQVHSTKHAQVIILIINLITKPL